MISRHWKCIARPHESERYLRHLRETTFPQLAAIHGFLGASVLRRAVPEGIQFLVATRWRSLEVIRQFAGEPEDQAVVPVPVQAMMVAFDTRAEHFELAATFPEPRNPGDSIT